MNEEQIEKKMEGSEHPRVTLDGMHHKIKHTEIVKHITKTGQVLRWCVLTLENGFAVTGDPSCSVSPENDNKEIGESIAMKNAEDMVWILEGYLLKQKIHEGNVTIPCSEPEAETSL